jgi:lysophospholipase L1-like esterase
MEIDECKSQSKVHYIRNSESLTSKFENAFMKDGVHFNTTGQRELVRMIKRHLNPHLGLQPLLFI